jgi:hypothetical protein
LIPSASGTTPLEEEQGDEDLDAERSMQGEEDVSSFLPFSRLPFIHVHLIIILILIVILICSSMRARGARRTGGARRVRRRYTLFYHFFSFTYNQSLF